MRRLLILAVAAALAPGLAAADVIVLKAGGRVEGQIVEERPDSVVIDVPAGRVTLPRTLIAKTIAGSSSLAEFRARAARLADDDVEGWLALAEWARARELVTQSREAYEHVLWIQPLNAVAHQALGHVFVEGRWMTRDDAYRARGFVQYEGSWVSPEERQAAVEQRLAEAAERRERIEAEARIREAEARARTAEAEARRAEVAAQAEADAYANQGIPYPYVYGGGGYGVGGYGYGDFVVGPVQPVPPPPPVVVVAPRPPQRGYGPTPRAQSSSRGMPSSSGRSTRSGGGSSRNR